MPGNEGDERSRLQEKVARIQQSLYVILSSQSHSAHVMNKLADAASRICRKRRGPYYVAVFRAWVD